MTSAVLLFCCSAMLLLLLVAAGPVPAVPAARLLFLLFLLLYCSCSCCCCWWWWWCWHPLMLLLLLLLLLLPRHQPRQETNSQKYRQATKSHRRSAALVEPLAKQHIQVQERPKRLQKPNSSSLARSPLLGRGRRILESNTRTPIESILTAAAAAVVTINQRRKQESNSQTSFSKPTRSSKTQPI